jgi:hypothetical protein
MPLCVLPVGPEDSFRGKPKQMASFVSSYIKCLLKHPHIWYSVRTGPSGDQIPVGGADFPHPSRAALWGPSSLLYNGYRVFPRVKAAGAWHWPPTFIVRKGDSHLKNNGLISTPNGLPSSPRNRAILPHTPMASVGHCLHNLFSLPAPTPTTSSRRAQAIFRAKPVHVLDPTFSPAVTLHTCSPMKLEQSVPKRWHLNYRCRGITQNKGYDTI